MSAVLWVVVAYVALSVLLTIGQVGKRRDPITPGVAVTSVIINGALIIALLVDQGVLG